MEEVRRKEKGEAEVLTVIRLQHRGRFTKYGASKVSDVWVVWMRGLLIYDARSAVISIFSPF